jgi:hypothetical protein
MDQKAEPVVVEFESPNYPSPGAKHHFIGASLDDVLADTEQGTEFGFANFSSYRVVPPQEVEGLNLGYYQEGYDAIREGCKSFKLDTPRD